MSAPPDGRPTLCLCMMVRNEGRVVARALRSVREHVDYWVVCDTGSTDDTIPEVLNAMAGVPGQLHRTTWVNFGHNRERALRLAQGKADYVLILDADMVANVHAPFKHKLAADAYLIRYEGACDYAQTMLVASRVAWRYVGVTHEYMTAPQPTTPARLPELTLTHHGDGGMRGEKYARDERLLRAAHEADPADVRTVFYLAQTYFDMGRFSEALPLYRRRAEMAGWDEERWYARLRVGQCLERMGEPPAVCAASFVQAFDARPTRLEPLAHVVRALREAGDVRSAYEAAKLGVGLPYPADVLFIDRPLHRYGFQQLFAECAADAGDADEARAAVDRVFGVADLPPAAYDAALQLRVALDGTTDAEFVAFAGKLGHDADALRRGEELTTFGTAPSIDTLRPIGSHATPEQRARRKATFFHPAIAARRALGQGRHDIEEAITFAGADRDPTDVRTFGTHLPLHYKMLSVRHKVVPAGQTWDVTVRGDRWGLHPMEDLYVLLNVDTLVLERDAELVVRGNILSFLCQRVIAAPGSRVAILPTPFSVDYRTGDLYGTPGANGIAGVAGEAGRPLSLGGSMLGPIVPSGDIDPATLAGTPGTCGTDGERGVSGRNGGMAKIAELTFRSVEGELTIFGQPGSGGNGGAGGNGGDGGAGGDGADGRQLLTTTIPAGVGGDGGAGGVGGRGGPGGNGGLCSNIYVSVPPGQVGRVKRVALPGPGGRGGAGGVGGAGGRAGVGGVLRPTSTRGPDGRPGEPGADGAAGVNGRTRPAPWIFLNDEP